MKALIWKEWREQRVFLLFVVGILLCINIGSIIYLNIPSETVSPIAKLDDINQNIFLGGGWVILPALFALILGTLPFVKEFSNNTQDFLLQRPIATVKIFWLKFFFGIFLLLLSIQLCHLVLPVPYSFLVKELSPSDVKYHYFTFFYFFFILLYSAVFFSSLLVKKEWPAMLLSPLVIAIGILYILPLYLILLIILLPAHLLYLFSFKIIIFFTAYILFVGFILCSFLIWQKAISKGIKPVKIFFSITGIIFSVYLVAHTILNITTDLELSKTLKQAKASGIKLTLEEIIPPPVPDEQNAALVYQEVFILADKLKEKHKDEWEYITYEGLYWNNEEKLEELTREQKENIAKLLLEDAEFIKLYTLIEEAVNFLKCRFDLNYEGGVEMLLPHLQKMRQLARLVAARTYILAEEKRYNEAWKSFLVGLKIGESLKDEPILIPQLVRIAVNGIATTSLYPIISISPEEISINDYQGLISEIDKKGKKLTEALEGDLPWAITFGFGKLLRGDVKEFISSGVLGPKDKFLSRLYVSYPAKPLLKQDYTFYVSSLIELIGLSHLPYYQAKDRLAELDRKIETAGYRYKYILTAMIIPALNRTQLQQARDNAQLDGLKLACALKIYKKNKGYYPDNLTALVSDIIPELPFDPFTGENFIYRKEKEGFIVYSIGPNEKDDDGISYQEYIKESREFNYYRGDYDIIWKCKE